MDAKYQDRRKEIYWPAERIARLKERAKQEGTSESELLGRIFDEYDKTKASEERETLLSQSKKDPSVIKERVMSALIVTNGNATPSAKASFSRST